jgi:hypothetical protein
LVSDAARRFLILPGRFQEGKRQEWYVLHVSEFRVVKERTRTRLRIGGEDLVAEVFVSPATSKHPGQETLLDLLAGQDPFIACDAMKSMRCVHRDAIAVAWVDSIPAELNDAWTAPSPPQAVEVVLQDGTRLEGSLRYSLPDDSSRVLDYLNSAQGFFPLHQEREVALINRSFVAQVIVEPRLKAIPKPKPLKAVKRAVKSKVVSKRR